MNACNAPQAAPVLLLWIFFRATFSLTSSAFRMPALVARLLTAVMRSAVCSAAPLTWIVKLHDEWLPVGSWASSFTVVVPIGNTLPDAGTEVRLATEQLSDAAAAANETATPCGLVALTTLGAGHVMTGFSVSWTVTVNVQGSDFDCGS